MEQDRMSRDKPTHLGSPNYDKGFPHGAVVKNTAVNAGDARDMGLITSLGRSPGEGNGNSLQYSCLENPHGQRSLAGYSSWSHKESNTTERLALSFFFFLKLNG